MEAKPQHLFSSSREPAASKTTPQFILQFLSIVLITCVHKPYFLCLHFSAVRVPNTSKWHLWEVGSNQERLDTHLVDLSGPRLSDWRCGAVLLFSFLPPSHRSGNITETIPVTISQVTYASSRIVSFLSSVYIVSITDSMSLNPVILSHSFNKQTNVHSLYLDKTQLSVYV